MKNEHWVMVILLLVAMYLIVKSICLFFKENKKQKGMWFAVSSMLANYLGEIVIIEKQKFLVTKKDYINKKVYVEPLEEK
jgi:hypothetical protein